MKHHSLLQLVVSMVDAIDDVMPLVAFMNGCELLQLLVTMVRAIDNHYET